MKSAQKRGRDSGWQRELQIQKEILKWFMKKMKRKYLALFPFLVLILLISIYSGLLRGDVNLPFIRNFAFFHGLLFVTGFFAGLISLERVVAINKFWGYFPPLFFILGSFLILFNKGNLPLILFISGNIIFLLIYIEILRKHFHFSLFILLLGAISLFISNLLIFKFYLNKLSLLYISFFVLTISGERLELSKIQRIDIMHNLFIILNFLLFLSAILSPFYPVFFRISGILLILSSLWLFNYDIAVKTLKMKGLRRYMAVGIILSYFWLLVAGILFLIYGFKGSGFIYDIELHSIFLGFVFSMVFAHAPIIFPTITGKELKYSSLFYLHLILLHLSLLIRLFGDILHNIFIRKHAILLNAISLLFFLFVTILSIKGREGK